MPTASACRYVLHRALRDDDDRPWIKPLHRRDHDFRLVLACEPCRYCIRPEHVYDLLTPDKLGHVTITLPRLVEINGHDLLLPPFSPTSQGTTATITAATNQRSYVGKQE